MRYALLILSLAASSAAFGQDADATVAALKQAYEGQKAKILRFAEAMPDAGWGVAPKEGVGARTFAQIVGHIADANAGICSGMDGGERVNLNAERGMTAKAEIMAALNRSFTICDTAVNNTNAANHDSPIQGPFGPPTPRVAALFNALLHSEDMYGQMAVYVRAQGATPAGRGGGGKGKGGKGK